MARNSPAVRHAEKDWEMPPKDRKWARVELLALEGGTEDAEVGYDMNIQMRETDDFSFAIVDKDQ